MMTAAAQYYSALVAMFIGALSAKFSFGQAPDDHAAHALVQQLGDDKYAQREAAQSALLRLGGAAVSSLQQAIADSADPEIRWRAAVVLKAVEAARADERARKVLAEWQGTWITVNGQWLQIEGDRWASGTPTLGPFLGKFVVSEIRESVALVDVHMTGGPSAGRVCKMILRRDGKSLEYCGTYEPVHPAEFRTSSTQLHLIWQPAPKDFVIPKVPESVPVPVPVPPIPR
jgi:hypothetical protein